MPSHTSSQEEIFQKLITIGKRLCIRGKFNEARRKLELALSLLEKNHEGSLNFEGSIAYTTQDLRVAIADCICREADEVRDSSDWKCATVPM